MFKFRKPGTTTVEGKFQMAPMIDIVFLLLIFFICVTTFEQLESEEEINLANASDSRDISKIPGTVMININKRGAIVINNVTFNYRELEGFLKTLTSKHGPDISVIIRADKKLRYENILKIMDICSSSGIWNVSFATIKEG